MGVDIIKMTSCDDGGIPQRIEVEFDDGTEVWEETYELVASITGVELYEASSIDTGSISFPRLICPRCGNAVPIEVSDEGTTVFYKPEYPHCPYCGVRVDESGHDGGRC